MPVHRNDMSMLEYAMAYGERGFKIHPCHPGRKKPILKDWVTQATDDPDQISVWWSQYPRANIGCVPGRSGHAVIDIDTNHGTQKFGHESLKRLQEDYGKLPDTVHQHTGSGTGEHLFFKKPDTGLKIRSRNNALGQGIDVKADGGNIILPPSIHPDTGRRYEWKLSSSPFDMPMATLPDWLVELLVEKDEPSSPARPQPNTGEPGEQLEDAADALKCVPADNRDIWLEMGMALHSTGAGEASYKVWDTWSRTSGKYDPKDQRRVWESFGKGTHGREVTLGTLFYRAQQYGWVRKGGRPSYGAEKLQIYIKGGALPQITDEAEKVLLDAGEQIYQRGGSLVRPAKLSAGLYQGVNRWEATPVLQQLETPFLVDRLTRLASFMKYDVRSKKWKNIDCPRSVAETLLARSGHWRFPPLRAIIEAPTLRSDGTVVDKQGYDQASELLYQPNEHFEPIPDPIKQEDISWARDLFIDLLSTFPFAGPEDWSVALSAILTPLVRPSIPTAPLHAFSSPVAGTGKSLLVDVCSLVATGRRAAVISTGEKDEELDKRLDAALLAGDPIISIDNVTRFLDSEKLCQALTQTVVRIRILGKSLTRDCPSTATVFATGNNLQVMGDMARRTLLCRLDAGCESPEERTFDRDLYKYVSEKRPDLVRAGLILLREYQVQGCPDVDLIPMGSFETWSTWVRAPIVWAGFADPTESKARILDEDPARELLQKLFHGWSQAFVDRRVTVKELAEKSANNSRLHEALKVIAGKGEEIDTRRLGRWLSRHKDQVVDGLRLVNPDSRQGTHLWQMVSTRSPAGRGGRGERGFLQAIS